MSDLEKKFIKCVRQEIATRKLTLTEVGEAIGSSRQVLSQILNGKFNSMRAGTMLRLAMVLRISLDEIIFPKTDLVVDSMTLAQALEAAEKRIAVLEDDLRNSTISNPDRFKIYGYTVKDLLLFAVMCKRNDVREADLKNAAWNLEFAVRAYAREREEIIKNTMDEIVARFTPDFEKACAEMMEDKK